MLRLTLAGYLSARPEIEARQVSNVLSRFLGSGE
jgi:hypothetical protein